MRKIYLLLAFVLVLLLSSCQTKTFEVNFYADDVLLKSEEVETNQSATAPDAPDKEGYTFIKWDQDFSKVSKDLKVNAVYEIKKYQVKFFVDDNQIGEVQYVNHGEAAVAPDVVIIKPGYKHIGWDKDGKNIQASIDIFAKFEEVTDRYTLSLSEGVTSNTDLTDLLYNQEVTITVTTPEGKKLVNVKLNGEIISLLDNNTHTFRITSDTNIEATFQDYVEPTSVQIFYLNDFHGSILPNGDEMGLAKIANFINKKKEENPNAIFLAGGDMLQGSALSNHYKGKSTLKLLDMMGLDFFTIGNHEFDWGIDTVSNNFGGQTPYVSYPLVSANIFKKGTENLVDNAAPYHIIEKGGIKFGIIGYIGYGLENSISANQVKDYEFRQPGPIVEHWSNYLRVNEGVDFVIAVGHDVESNDYIRNLTGNSKVDLIFNGHHHQKYVEFSTGKAPLIQSSSNGRAVGYVEINNVSGVISINQSKTMNHTYYTDILFSEEDPVIKAQIQTYVDETDSIFNTPIIENNNSISRGEFAIWLSKLIALRTGSDVGVYNSGGVRDEISPEAITLGVLYKVLPFDNLIRSASVSYDDAYRESRYHPSHIATELESGQRYQVVTNEYVFDKETSAYMLRGTNHITYEGDVRSWVMEELEAQAAKGLKFSVDNDIETRISSTNNEKGDIYGTTSFVFANR